MGNVDVFYPIGNNSEYLVQFLTLSSGDFYFFFCNAKSPWNSYFSRVIKSDKPEVVYKGEILEFINTIEKKTVFEPWGIYNYWLI